MKLAMREFMNKSVTNHTALFDSLQNLIEEGIRLPAHIHIIHHTKQQDYIIAREFLLNYKGSQATFNAYRREVERILQWAWNIANISITQITREAFENFISFCQNPPKTWIGKNNVPRFKLNNLGEKIQNPAWRPFVAKLKFEFSANSIKDLIFINNSFFNHLVLADRLRKNPVQQIKQKSRFIQKKQTNQQIRRLSNLQWEYVINTVETMAIDNPIVHERTLFIISCLYGMYLRISELVISDRWTPKMNDFFQDSNQNWWFRTVGKGNKLRQISVSNSMLAALKRYRNALGLTSLPSKSDQSYLIPKSIGVGGITSTRQIRKIVQKCFTLAINAMQQHGFIEEAEQLESATVHWLRHTGISDDVKIRPREHVRDDAGHYSSAITDKYIDIELQERHNSAKNKEFKQ
jgi:site-specific recombinase XerC